MSLFSETDHHLTTARQKKKTREKDKDAHHGSAEGKEGLEKRVERGDGVLDALGTLHSPSVESNVRVGELLDERDESRDDGVKSVS